MLGTSLSAALLVVALFSFGSVEFMVDVLYFQSDRQDATLSFAEARPPSVIAAVGGLPGVLRTEPFRSVAVKMRSGPRERRINVVGKPPGTDLSRVLDLDLRPVVLPESGLALGDRVADILDVQRGDLVEVEVLEGSRRKVDVPVTEIIQSYLGLVAFMDLDALNRLAGEGPRVSGVYLALDESALDALYKTVKQTPAVSGVTLQAVSRERFGDTVRGNITIMVSVYVTLSVIIAFGVVYNSARIQLSERARELATLRVLGFTRREVSQVLLTELALIVALAQPLGWLIGYGFSVAVITGFESDLFRVPLVVSPETFAYASLVVLGSAAVSALIVRRRVDDFDLVQVLKTRE
jgi:putative ABC transport system permease protein